MKKLEYLHRWPITMVFLLFSMIAFPSFAQEQEEQQGIQHTPLTSFYSGEIMEIRATIPAETEIMRFYFRYGMEEFQVRNMAKEEYGSFVYEFDTSLLPVLEFEYYLEAVSGETVIYYPQEAPAAVISVVGQSEEPMPEIPEDFPSPEEEEKKFRLPLSVSGSVVTKIKEKEPIPEEKRTTVDGNLRVFENYSKGDLSIDFDSNFLYTNTPFEGDKKFDLSNMMLSLAKAAHTLNAGDINISESQYSVGGLGRRGFEYIFDDQTAYFHLFDVSSQQPKGFSGFGIPKSNISIMGGALGFRVLDDAVSVKAIFITGKDDPAEGASVGFSEEVGSREGKVFAFVHEGSFANNLLSTSAEYARSNYDGDLEDDVEPVSDHAYNFGGSINYGTIGTLNLGAQYSYIGSQFNSIGYQFFTNDRKGYETNVGFTYKNFNISGSFLSNQDNVTGDPASPTTKDKNISGNLSLGISDKATVSVGYRRDKQNTFEDDVETFLQDSLSKEIMGSLSFYLSPEVSLDVSVTNSDVSSENDPSSDSRTLTVNVGSSIRKGDVFSFSPSYSYSKMLDRFTEEETLTHNAFLSAEVYFVPQVFSLNFSGSYNRTEIPLGDLTQAFDLGGGLNLYLDKLIKIGSLMLTLKGSYLYNKMGEASDSDYKVLFQCDFAF